MREVGSHSKPAAGDGRGDGQSPVRLGRRAGQWLFWAFALYVAGMGTWSVITQVFELVPDPAHVDPACIEQLASLNDDLQQRMTDVVGDRVRADSDARWFATWDESYRQFSNECRSLHHARLHLRALRQRAEVWLGRYRRDQLPLVQRIDDRVRKLGASSLPQPRDI